MNCIRSLMGAAIMAILMFITGTQGGFPCLICPAPGRGISLISCNLDCRVGHNAEFGKCGRNFNCFCSLPLETVNILGVQCVDPAAAVLFDEICKIDCQCNHGALGGQCDYVRHGCTCIGHSEPFGTVCPFGSAKEFISWSKSSNAAAEFAFPAQVV